MSSCLLGCGTQDEAEDEAEVCVLCCQKRSTVAVCDECKEHYYMNVLTPTLVGPMLFVKYNTDDSWSCFTDIALLCNVLCREDVQCNVVYLGGVPMRG